MEGFRLQRMLRLFIKSIAYYHGRHEVNYEDLKEFNELVTLIGFPEIDYVKIPVYKKDQTGRIVPETTCDTNSSAKLPVTRKKRVYGKEI